MKTEELDIFADEQVKEHEPVVSNPFYNRTVVILGSFKDLDIKYELKKRGACIQSGDITKQLIIL